MQTITSTHAKAATAHRLAAAAHRVAAHARDNERESTCDIACGLTNAATMATFNTQDTWQEFGGDEAAQTLTERSAMDADELKNRGGHLDAAEMHEQTARYHDMEAKK